MYVTSETTRNQKTADHYCCQTESRDEIHWNILRDDNVIARYDDLLNQLGIESTGEILECPDFLHALFLLHQVNIVDMRDCPKDSYAYENWHDDEPTESQLNYLRILGCPKAPQTKWEASQLIDEYKARNSTR